MKFLLALLLLLTACKATYKHESIKESVQMVAKRDYKLDVEVQEAGKTLGVQYRVKNLFSELTNDDQKVWKTMDHLMQSLTRVALSVDVQPDFVVLEIADEDNPGNKIVFTQYVTDIKKIYAEVLSRNQYFDRLAIEFEINGERTPFDQEEIDIVQLMMLSVEAQAAELPSDTEFKLREVTLRDFLPKVAASLTRRFFRENKNVKESAVLRGANAKFDENFKLFLDVASRPGHKITTEELEAAVLPMVAEEMRTLFKSYRFDAFKNIVVMDKTSGAMTMLGRK